MECALLFLLTLVLIIAIVVIFKFAGERLMADPSTTPHSAGSAANVVDETAAIPADVFAEVENLYMDEVRKEIKASALELARKANRPTANKLDAFRAFEQRFNALARMEPLPFWREHLLLLVATTLTIAFGAMALLPYALSADPAKLPYKPEAFLDIVKLFAGVIVGGAAGVGTAALLSPSRGK